MRSPLNEVPDVFVDELNLDKLYYFIIYYLQYLSYIWLYLCANSRMRLCLNCVQSVFDLLKGSVQTELQTSSLLGFSV